ncbi:hypothetical protein [Aureispira anguillae]|uniref:Uncharacterized protein n=1 Tax=Aureispira anguillae TaxID=2864201 RepID=A0A916DTT5_9BACT|nr:hypothetical protein [Aureispira anguillae]BDS13539.1 hypothetical protein AsAng_0042780 [Aureispira anguillae]
MEHHNILDQEELKVKLDYSDRSIRFLAYNLGILCIALLMALLVNYLEIWMGGKLLMVGIPLIAVLIGACIGFWNGIQSIRFRESGILRSCIGGLGNATLLIVLFLMFYAFFAIQKMDQPVVEPLEQAINPLLES